MFQNVQICFPHIARGPKCFLLRSSRMENISLARGRGPVFAWLRRRCAWYNDPKWIATHVVSETLFCARRGIGGASMSGSQPSPAQLSLPIPPSQLSPAGQPRPASPAHASPAQTASHSRRHLPWGLRWREVLEASRALQPPMRAGPAKDKKDSSQGSPWGS